MLPLRYAWAWRLVGWLGVVVALVFSLWPGGVPLPFSVWDKIEHSSGYLLLAFWFLGLYPREKYLRVGAASFLFGVMIELLQGLTPTRSMDPADVAANALGISVALALAYAGLGGWAARIEGLRRAPTTTMRG
jgi:VanZ family protein